MIRASLVAAVAFGALLVWALERHALAVKLAKELDAVKRERDEYREALLLDGKRMP